LQCFHRTRPLSEDLCGSLDREVGDHPQQDRGALVGREPFQRREDGRGVHTFHDLGFVPRDLVPQCLDRGVRHDLIGLPGAPSARVDEPVVRNREHPRLQIRRVAFESRKSAHDRDEDISGEALGIPFALASEVTDDDRREIAIQRRHGRFVAPTSSLHNRVGQQRNHSNVRNPIVKNQPRTGVGTLRAAVAKPAARVQSEHRVASCQEILDTRFLIACSFDSGTRQASNTRSGQRVTDVGLGGFVMRRFQTLVLVAAITTFVGASAFMSSAGAAAPPVTGVGTVSCVLTGHLGFNPPLANGGTATTETVTVVGNLNGCSGTGDGALVAHGKATGAVILSTNDCSGVESALSAVTTTVKWKTTTGSPKLASTTVDLTSGSATINSSNKLQLDASGSATAGSFSGDTASVTAVVTQSLKSLAKACTNANLKAVSFAASASSASLS
jgi:hypothetical protein